jgi:N-carbamoyl-L-amino-acid hydrolase
VDRQAFTDGDRQARALLAEIAQARGFTVTQDAMANLFLRREGRDPLLPPILTGSHLDTQPSGGRYDGALGVLASLEVLDTLEDQGVETQRAVEVVAWTNEEGSRFSPGAMGSRAFAQRAISRDWADQRDRDGVALAPELAETIAALDVASRPLGFPVHLYVELHIEQGPVLEREQIPAGIVTGIQGTRWLEVGIEGQAAHAGTTPLAFRRDALSAAVEAIGALNRSLMPEDSAARFTVGRIAVSPGSVNAIAGRVSFSVDLRHPERVRLDVMELAVTSAVGEAAARHQCQASVDRTLDMAPCLFPDDVVRSLEEAARRAGVATMRLQSGAYHDALFLAGVAPAAMLFVPSRGGLSHNEAEFTEARDIEAGLRVLYEAVRAAAAR